MVILALITLLLSLLTMYLLWVRFSKTKIKAVKKKHPVGSPNFELYRELYSAKTLAFTAFLSVSSIISLLVNLYKSGRTDAPIWMSLLILASTLAPLGLYVWWLAKKKNQK